MMLIMMMEVVISSCRDLMIHGCGEDYYREFKNISEHHVLNDALPPSSLAQLSNVTPSFSSNNKCFAQPTTHSQRRLHRPPSLLRRFSTSHGLGNKAYTQGSSVRSSHLLHMVIIIGSED